MINYIKQIIRSVKVKYLRRRFLTDQQLAYFILDEGKVVRVHIKYTLHDGCDYTTICLVAGYWWAEWEEVYTTSEEAADAFIKRYHLPKTKDIYSGITGVYFPATSVNTYKIWITK